MPIGLPLPRIPGKGNGKIERSEGAKVRAISGSRSDYASVANESLSHHLVKKYLYIRSHYWPRCGSKYPSPFNPPCPTKLRQARYVITS